MMWGEGGYYLQDSDPDFILSGFTHTDFENNTNFDAKEFLSMTKQHTVQMEELKLNVYIIVELYFKKNSKN